MPPRKLRKKKGIVGIESAIVMIAFVIVAAALAFVVLNMGFFTTQETRGAIQRGLGEASSALELDGTVVAHVNITTSKIDYWFATIKLSSGQHKVDLTPVKAVISYWSPQRGISLANTYLTAVTTPLYDPDTVVEIIKVLIASTESDLNPSQTKCTVWYNFTKDSTKYFLAPGKENIPYADIHGEKGSVATYYVGYNSTLDVWVIFNTSNKATQYVTGESWSKPWVVFNGTLCNWTGTDFQKLDSTKGISLNKDDMDVVYTVKIGLPDDISESNKLDLYKFYDTYNDGIISVIAWITKTNDDTVLDPGEKLLLVMYYHDSEYCPQGYDTIKSEAKVPIGAPLTIERTVPPSLTQEIVDLG